MKRPLSLLFLLAAVACDDDPEIDETVGELGNGTFRYVCVGESDPACPTDRLADSFPDVVGTDGTFDLEFDPDEGSSAGIVIEPAATTFIEVASGELHAVRSGTTAMLAIRRSTDRVLDLVYMSVADVAAVEIEQRGGLSPRTSIDAGATQTYQATPRDDDGDTLAGARDFEWQVSDPRVIRLEMENPAAEMQVRGVAPGRATLTVTTGDVSDSLTLTVTEGNVVIDAGVVDDASTPDFDAAVPPDAAGPDASSAPDSSVVVEAGVDSGTNATTDGSTAPSTDAAPDATDGGPP